MPCTYQINSLGLLLGHIVTPGLTPQPLLGEGLDGYLVDHVVGQILRRTAELMSALSTSASGHAPNKHTVHSTSPVFTPWKCHSL